MTDPVDDADRLEQKQAITEEVGPSTPVPADADPADAVDQRRAVPLDEDDAPR